MSHTEASSSTGEHARLREHIRESWADLTQAEIDWVGDEPDRLAAALSQKYGISRDEAARQVWHFMEELPEDATAPARAQRQSPVRGEAE